VKSLDVGDGEVKNNDLAADSVGSGKIADRQVKNADLSIGASSSNTIADGGVQGVDVKNETLTGTQIVDDSLTGQDISESSLSVPAVRADFPRDDVGGCSFIPVIPGDGTLTPLKWTAERFDTANMHASGCAPDRSRVTAPHTGVYQVSAGIVWTINATGTRFLGLRVNGNDNLYFAASRVPGLADIPEQSVSTLVKLNANDYVEAVVSQNSGSAFQVDGNFLRQHLAMHWVGPG
jgi:hypothetical protein